MWAGLSLLLTLCLLHGGGAESDGGGPRCQLPPSWKIGELDPMSERMGRVTVVALLQASWLFCLVQASRLDSLRLKLESQGLRDVAYMVVNHQGAHAQRLHSTLAQRLTENIVLYKQEEQQPDVWQTLGGEKDDFFIYDRCGRLTQHISLPYSDIGQGHVEGAIKDAYCKRACGHCTHESAEVPEECKSDAQPDAAAAPAVEEDTGHGRGHGRDHHHGHHHGHGHAHHGDNPGFHPRGLGHGDGHHPGRHHGDHDQHDHGQRQSHLDLSPQGQQQDVQVLLRQQHEELGQMQQAVNMHQMVQEAHGAPVMPWVPKKLSWKSKYSWQWAAGSDNEASPQVSWCWHWRRLFGEVGSEEPVGLWHCDEALPASWQWHGLTGDAANNVRETWQWRLHLAAWQQPQPDQWPWPPGVASWGWEQL